MTTTLEDLEKNLDNLDLPVGLTLPLADPDALLELADWLVPADLAEVRKFVVTEVFHAAETGILGGGSLLPRAAALLEFMRTIESYILQG